MTTSAIYRGTIRHRRFGPVEHEFSYRVFMLLLDLDELPSLFDRYPLWSARRPAPARWRREDYMGDPERPLSDVVRDLVEEKTGDRPRGPVRLLTHPRYLGVGFNPISVYYCFDPSGERVEHAVAEVTNTPWGGRHSYVLDRGERDGKVLAGEFDKVLHVSPLMDMDYRYSLRLTEPASTLTVHIDSAKESGHAFDATLAMERRELNGRGLMAALASYPPQSLATLGRIYWQALKLKLKGARYHQPPEGATTPEETGGASASLRDTLEPAHGADRPSPRSRPAREPQEVA